MALLTSTGEFLGVDDLGSVLLAWQHLHAAADDGERSSGRNTTQHHSAINTYSLRYHIHTSFVSSQSTFFAHFIVLYILYQNYFMDIFGQQSPLEKPISDVGSEGQLVIRGHTLSESQAPQSGRYWRRGRWWEMASLGKSSSGYRPRFQAF